MKTWQEIRSYLGEVIGGHPFYNSKIKEALDRRSDEFIYLFKENQRLELRIKDLEGMPTAEPLTTQRAVSKLCKDLSEDKSEGSYYYSWQSNIAMAFVDEARRNKTKMKVSYKNLHTIANQAAKNFLDLLIG